MQSQGASIRQNNIRPHKNKGSTLLNALFGVASLINETNDVLELRKMLIFRYTCLVDAFRESAATPEDIENCFYTSLSQERKRECPSGQKFHKSDILSPLLRGGYKAGINNSARFE